MIGDYKQEQFNRDAAAATAQRPKQRDFRTHTPTAREFG